MPDYAGRCRISTLIIVRISFWRNYEPFKKHTHFSNSKNDQARAFFVNFSYFQWQIYQIWTKNVWNSSLAIMNVFNHQTWQLWGHFYIFLIYIFLISLFVYHLSLLQCPVWPLPYDNLDFFFEFAENWKFDGSAPLDLIWEKFETSWDWAVPSSGQAWNFLVLIRSLFTFID